MQEDAAFIYAVYKRAIRKRKIQISTSKRTRMATAYAALTSLMHLISDLRQHPHPPIRLEDEHFDSLNSKISFFQKFLEDHHTSVDLELDLRIANAAYDAEDVIETHITDEDFNQEDFDGSLPKAIEGMYIIEKEVVKMKWNTETKTQGNYKPIRPSDSGEKAVVGIEDLTIKIVDKITSPHGSGRQIISITGMGGIGKTTLADEVYNHPYVRNYFDVHAWATISKEYNIHESLVELLHCLDRAQSKENLRRKGEQELGVTLYQFLCGRRYLVIVDDLWNVEAWDRLRSFFPNSRGSGIVITTRESRIASISSHAFAMNLLDKRKTWDLFCKTVFGQDDCPCELEDVGKEISDKCRGLPLSVVVIGGHLAKSPETQEYWESVAKNLSSIVNSEDDDRCLKILSLSYVQLPVYLKPCFLYMGVFPEDEEIIIEKLIRLWVAEGFIKPIYGKSVEDVAQGYLNDLIGRNLVLVSSSSGSGEITGCRIHDLLRDLSLKEALEKNFLRIVRKHDLELSYDERRIVLYPNSYEVDRYYSNTNVQKSRASTLRTLILHDTLLPSVVCKSSLRVLASARSLNISLHEMVKVISQLVNLRCLEFSSSSSNKVVTFPSSIIFIWNLQSLYIRDCAGAKAPEEIWKMSQLRHIRITDISLSDPPSESGDILSNLQSAKMILNFSFREDLMKRIPNVRILSVRYDDLREGFSEGAYALHNIARLEKLEALSCWLYGLVSLTRRNEMISSLTFPHSLKKLTVSGLRFDDEVTMTKIGSLPLLEELSLTVCGGSEWELVEGQFVSLKYLQLYGCSDLECFTADSSHFPCLEEMELFGMDSLVEISSDIGDIQTLRCIELNSCMEEAVVCAKEIVEYQKQEGNEELQIMGT